MLTRDDLAAFLRLITYCAAPGSPTQAAFRRLAQRATTPPTQAAFRRLPPRAPTPLAQASPARTSPAAPRPPGMPEPPSPPRPAPRAPTPAPGPAPGPAPRPAPSAALALLLVRHQVPRPRAAALWAAAALWTELSAGRAAFTVGLAAAVGCVVVAGGSRPRGWARLLATAGLALLTCLLSPVAALFLGVVAAVFAVTGRWREGLAVGVGAGLPLGAMAVFSDGRVPPIGVRALPPPPLAPAGGLLPVPRRRRVVPVSAGV